MKARLLLLAVVVGCMLMLGAGVSSAAEDHPVIKPMPGSTLEEDYYVHKTFDALELWISTDEGSVLQTVKGEYWELQYEFLDASGAQDDSVSYIEITDNYRNAALSKGGEVLYDLDGVLSFTVPTSDSLYWVYFESGDGWYSLYIVREEGLKQKVNFGADELKAELDKTGRIAIYGINFETDKADLMLGAEVQLIELVKLMKNNASLKIEIQGHTDNVGADDYNQTLSEKRANTVKSFMMLYGISSDRLTAVGYGETTPVASNDTEEGRAMNRRVEIVKKG